MKTGVWHERAERPLLIAIALIPAFMGVLAFLNNLSGWDETVQRMVHPMLSMQGTFGNPGQTWRAVDSLGFANVVYVVVFTLEGLFGLLAIGGIVAMIRGYSKPDAGFQLGLRIVKTACMLAVFVYGFVFFTIGGDWFLAWQNPDLDGLQTDAVNYGIVVAIVYVILDSKTASA